MTARGVRWRQERRGREKLKVCTTSSSIHMLLNTLLETPGKPPKPGRISSEHQALIDAEIARHDAVIAEIAELTGKPIPIITDLIDVPKTVRHRNLNLWSVFETYFSSEHSKPDGTLYPLHDLWSC